MMDRKFLVDAQVWKITDGKPQELKVDDRVFVLKPTTPTISKPKTYHIKHNVKISYLQKWVQDGDFEVFTLDHFFKKFPKQKYNKNLNKNIASLIDKKIISQFDTIDGKERYKVNKR